MGLGVGGGGGFDESRKRVRDSLQVSKTDRKKIRISRDNLNDIETGRVIT